MKSIALIVGICLAFLLPLSTANALEINEAFADLTETFEQMQKIVREERLSDAREYLERFPNGPHRQQVLAIIERGRTAQAAWKYPLSE